MTNFSDISRGNKEGFTVDLRKKIVIGTFAVLLILIYSGSVAAAPVHKGSIADGAGGALLSGPLGVFVSGNYAFVTSSGSNALEIIDVSNPAAPVHKGSITDGTGGALLNLPTSIYVSGNYAYVTGRNYNALEIVDVSNPATPVHKGSIANGDGGALLNVPEGVYVSGNYAYVASYSSNALEIVDISDIVTTPSYGGSIATIINANVQQQLSVAITNPFTGNWALSQGANSQNYGSLTITANVPWSESTSATNGDYLKNGVGAPLTNKLLMNAADVTAYTASGTGSSSTPLNFVQQVVMADPAGSYGTVVTFTVNAV
jgi:hypothetical protein